MGGHGEGNEAQGHGEGEPPPVTPFLLIRSTLTDRGNRPLVPGTVFWVSPDISFAPTDGAGSAVTGTDVIVSAQVTNLGLAAAFAVNVEFFWADPSMGILPSTGHLIASRLVTVPALSTVVVNAPRPWRPQSVNGGHECLIVQCDSPSEGAGGLTSPFMAALDRHVAQRNISVVLAGTQQMMMIRAGNPFSTRQDFVIDVLTLRGAIEAAPREQDVLVTAILAAMTEGTSSEAARGLGIAARAEVMETGAAIEIQSTDPSQVDAAGELVDFDRFLAEIGQAGEEPPGEGIVGEFALDEGRAVDLRIAVTAADVGPDEFVVHRLRQRVAGRTVGGYTLLVLRG